MSIFGLSNAFYEIEPSNISPSYQYLPNKIPFCINYGTVLILILNSLNACHSTYGEQRDCVSLK